jgi:hypothetical protein
MSGETGKLKAAASASGVTTTGLCQPEACARSAVRVTLNALPSAVKSAQADGNMVSMAATSICSPPAESLTGRPRRSSVTARSTRTPARTAGPLQAADATTRLEDRDPLAAIVVSFSRFIGS